MMLQIKKLHSLLALLTISLSAACFGSLSEMRTWKDQSGREIQATLIRYNETTQVGEFRRAEGFIVKIPKDLLSSTDQHFIESLLAEQAAVSSQNTAATPKETQSENYIFSGLSKVETDGYINTHEGWEHQAKALKTKVRYKGDRSSGNQYLKAYFYDRNKELIQSYKQPARIQNSDGGYTNPPKQYGKRVEVFFPISEFLEGRNWQRVIVVFGNENEARARIYPSGELSEYAFPERTLIFGAKLKSLSTQTNRAPAEQTKYTLSSARKSTYKNTAWVNGHWAENTPGIIVEVKVEKALPRSNYFLQVHYFDADNKLVFTQNTPTQIESDEAANTYTKLPKFAKTGRRHEAFFPFDNELEKHDWRKAVVIFGDDHMIDLKIIGGNSSSLLELTFPEKNRYSN